MATSKQTSAGWNAYLQREIDGTPDMSMAAVGQIIDAARDADPAFELSTEERESFVKLKRSGYYRYTVEAMERALSTLRTRELAPAEPSPDAPTDLAALPDFWDARRKAEGKPDASRCAAELRVALKERLREPEAKHHYDAGYKRAEFDLASAWTVDEARLVWERRIQIAYHRPNGPKYATEAEVLCAALNECFPRVGQATEGRVLVDDVSEYERHRITEARKLVKGNSLGEDALRDLLCILDARFPELTPPAKPETVDDVLAMMRGLVAHGDEWADRIEAARRAEMLDTEHGHG